MKRNGPRPLPPELKRTTRLIVSLPDDVGELIMWQPGRDTKSRIVDDALRLYFSMSAHERDARLLAIRFNSRTTVQ